MKVLPYQVTSMPRFSCVLPFTELVETRSSPGCLRSRDYFPSTANFLLHPPFLDPSAHGGRRILYQNLDLVHRSYSTQSGVYLALTAKEKKKEREYMITTPIHRPLEFGPRFWYLRDQDLQSVARVPVIRHLSLLDYLPNLEQCFRPLSTSTSPRPVQGFLPPPVPFCTLILNPIRRIGDLGSFFPFPLTECPPRPLRLRHRAACNFPVGASHPLQRISAGGRRKLPIHISG